MKLRNVLVAGFTALSMPLLAASPAHAGAGEWDALGYSYFEYHSSTNSFLSDVVNSGGGNFKFCVHNLGGVEPQWFKLKEYDASNADETIASGQFYEGDCGIYSVGAYGDGANGTPELYVEAPTRYDTEMWVEYWD